MLGLYLDTLKIGQKKLQYVQYTKKNHFCKKNYKMLWQIMCFGQKRKKSTTKKQKIKQKNPCQSRELNLGPLAPQSYALPSGPPG